MIDFDEHFGLWMFLLVVAVFFALFLIFIVGKAIDLAYIDNVPMTITQNGTVIYQGISGCVDVISGGDTTQVQTYDGFLCLFPKSWYGGLNIEVYGRK